MAIPIKDVAAITKKWQARAGAAAPDYLTGVNGTTKDQAALAEAAAPLWAQATAAAAANGSYARGLRRAGTSKWLAGAQTKGAVRYAPGVNAGGANFSTGFAPYQAVIANLTLPPRNVKGSNSARVDAVVMALMKQKQTGG